MVLTSEVVEEVEAGTTEDVLGVDRMAQDFGSSLDEAADVQDDNDRVLDEVDEENTNSPSSPSSSSISVVLVGEAASEAAAMASEFNRLSLWSSMPPLPVKTHIFCRLNV